MPQPATRIRNSVVAYSHSKDLNLPGERIGYLAVSPWAADAADVAEACVFCNRVLGFVNAPALFQRAVAKFQDLPADVSVYQMADVPWAFGMDEGQTRNAPLYVSFEEGSGKVIYTSWRLYANMDGKPREVIQFLVNRL